MIKEENINCTIEALILASPEPVSVKKLSEALADVSPARVRQAIGDLNNIYMGCGNSFRIREVAGGYQVHILPDFEQPIKKLLYKQRAVRLSRAALETLAIIAYKQPVTKIEIEHIRGVATDGVIHNLLQKQLIVIAGRAESPGRPLLYKTSNEFLKFFGLGRLSDLPRMDEIEEMIRMAETPRDQIRLPLNGLAVDVPVLDDLDEEAEPDNGDIRADDMIATAVVDETVDEFSNLEEDDQYERQSSGGNGSRPDGNGYREQDTENEQAPVLSFYEPIPDNPPQVFAPDESMPVTEDAAGQKNKTTLFVSEESAVSNDKSSDNGEQSPED